MTSSGISSGMVGTPKLKTPTQFFNTKLKNKNKAATKVIIVPLVELMKMFD